MTALRLALFDLARDRVRTVLTVLVLVPIAIAFTVMLGIGDGLVAEARDNRTGTNLLLLSPDSIDPTSGHLPQETVERTVMALGDAADVVVPVILRPVKVNEHVLQLRATDQDEWVRIHGLQLTSGRLPSERDQVVITEGIRAAIGWDVGDRVEIYGSEFEISGLVDAPGTKFASIWMPYDRAEELFEFAVGFQMVVAHIRPESDPVAARALLEAQAGDEFSVYFEGELADEGTSRFEAASQLSRLSTIIGVVGLMFASFLLAAITLTERRRDVGIARALGFSTVTIRTLVLVRTAIVTMVAYVLGGVVGAVILRWRGRVALRTYFVELGVSSSTWAIGSAIVVGTAVIGAWLATRSLERVPVRMLLEER